MTQLNLVSRQQQEDQPENFCLFDRIDEPITEPEMIFPEFWPAQTMGLFTGDGGVGKTHFTLQLLKLIASGGEIEGTLFQCARPRPVVYISQEDEADFIRGELLTQYPELKNDREVAKRIRIISTALKGPDLTLTNKTYRKYLMDNLPKGCVFVLDSWSTFLTCNENDNTELQKEIRYLRDIMKKCEATPFLIHHRPKLNAQTGIQSSFRGGTALPNNCRFHIMVESKSGAVKLSFEKVSRGQRPNALTLIFDEERKLLVPKGKDLYVKAFKRREQLTTTDFMKRIGKDPNDQKQRKQALDILRHREKAGILKKVSEAKKGQDAVWKRAK
jgi:RecA-family ATPase